MARGLTGAITNQSNNSKTYVTKEEFSGFKNKFVTARVLDIVYDENSPNFESFGEWNGIGTIQFQIVDDQRNQDATVDIAHPLFSGVKQYPLVNEIVYLIKMSDSDINTNLASTSFFYLNPTSIWNHPHHNAIPNPLNGTGVSDEQSRDYAQAGSARRVEDGSTEIDLNGESGGTFTEKTNIHPILPFAGDVLLEGRYGTSIRLGATNKTDSEYTNTWSDNGENGSPITIIRNGQPEDVSDEGWLPITEDINKDLSSITLTSDQKLPINLDSEAYEAFNEAPIAAPEFIENQIVLNSGRLVFNAKTDAILLASSKQISLTSGKTLGLSSTEDITLQTSNVNLGSKDATERVILGDSFMKQFKPLLDSLKNLTSALENLQDWPGGAPVPNVLVKAMASNTKSVIQSVLQQVNKESLVSKVTKTK